MRIDLTANPLQLAPTSRRRRDGICGIAFMAKASAPGPHQDPARAAADFRRSRRAQYRLPAGRGRQCAAGRASRAPHAGIAGYAAYGPPGSEDFFRHTCRRAIGLIGAWLPNFGDCLLHTIGEIFARGHGSAVVLNSDSPTLPTALLIETAEVLARAGRPRRARPVERRRLLSARAEGRAPPHVRRHRLEHRACRRTDA